MPRPCLPAALLLIAACGGPAKVTIPVVRLAPPPDTLAIDVKDLTSAAWLGGSRWAVTSPTFGSVDLVDFERRTVRPLGGLRNPELGGAALVRAQRDTLVVVDPGKRRTSLWTWDERLVGGVGAVDAARGALPKARDAAGAWYLELAPPARADGSGARDSARVLRLRADGTLDTVASLAPLDLAQVEGERGRRFERRLFSGNDHWGVLRDGTLWIARIYDHRLEWHAPDGTVTRSVPLPDRLIEVTRIDRELFYRNFPPELRTTAEQLPISPFKPWVEAAFDGPGPTVWIERPRSVADTVRAYLAVGRDAAVRYEVHLPGDARALAASADRLLAVAPKPGGMHLMEFALPPAPPAPAPTR